MKKVAIIIGNNPILVLTLGIIVLSAIALIFKEFSVGFAIGTAAVLTVLWDQMQAFERRKLK